MKIATSLLLLFVPALLYSQFRAQPVISPEPMPDVLGPPPVQWMVGLDAGLNVNQHPGSFKTKLCECTFSDGSGRGILLGGEIWHRFSRRIAISFKVLYDDLQGQYSSILENDTTLMDDGTKVPLDYERIGDVRLTYLMFNPMLQYSPFGELYVMAGPAVGITARAEYQYRLRHLNPDYVFVSTQTDESVIEDWTDIPDANTIRIDVRFGLGYNLWLSRAVVFSPEISYSVPMTGISNVSGWEANTLRAVGVIKFVIK